MEGTALSIWEAIIQGIIQGLTEFLPVSSSGHLSLYQYFTGRGGETGALFSLVLHLGTLIAVFIAFWGTIWPLVCEFFSMLGALFTGKLDLKRPNAKRRMILLLIVSLLPLGITFLIKDPIRAVAADNDIIVEGICFIVTGILLMLADRCVKGRHNAKDMSYRSALVIGTAQAIAPLPGVSRSGSTLSMGLLLGLDQKFAVSFSFIMGIPAVAGAILLDAKEIIGGGLQIPLPVLIAGLVTSAVFGIIAIGMVRWLVMGEKLRYFSYYTLILGSAVTVVGIYELVSDHHLQAVISALFH